MRVSTTENVSEPPGVTTVERRCLYMCFASRDDSATVVFVGPRSGRRRLFFVLALRITPNVYAVHTFEPHDCLVYLYREFV